ncbi:hypothetical protein B9G55_09635 [Saccharibacillus sp. O16]|nr:hypothetical protein B9G55_09635 [Saccharibacillus sp. O16]
MMNHANPSADPIPVWMTQLPESGNWVSAKLIDKGWSADRKYRIQTRSDEALLLRTSDAGLLQSKRAEFERVRQAAALGIPCSQPIAFGQCTGTREEGQPGGAPFVYSLLSWIEGDDAQDRLPDLPEHEAYRLGRQAGEWLRQMHSLDVPASAELPAISARRELARKREAYQRCGYPLRFDTELEQRIEALLPLLDGVPAGFRQGDYHPGNMILKPDGQLGIIDFNRSTTGDSCRDFNRLVTFTSRISLPFARGQLDGYLEAGPKEANFFGRMALYCAMECWFAIVWAIPFGEPEITDTLRRSEQIWLDYDGFERRKPVWYEA